MKTLRLCRSVLICFALVGVARASSVLPLSHAELIASSGAVFRGTVVGLSCFKETNGLIFTRASLRVDEALKGKFPEVVMVIHRGGRVGGDDQFYGFSPRFTVGKAYLLFVSRGVDGRLACIQGDASAFPLLRTKNGDFVADAEALLTEIRQLTSNGQIAGADVTDQVGSSGMTSELLTGMLGGVGARFVQPDRGDPIPYLIDADNLPLGMTLTQATNAVQQALNAWAAVTSLKFKFESIQSFGQGADTITNLADGKLRIQLHDDYNSINSPNTLGVGGRGATTSPLPAAGWDLGGNIMGNEFFKTTYGYVVLERTNTSMQNLSTFAEVLCHEVGHALNMAHSSENPSESSTLLKQAIMYFQAHADGRGAALGAYDPPVIEQIYPTNTAPYSYDRVIDVTTSPFGIPNVARINSVELRGYDLQSTNLTFQVTNAVADPLVGNFSVSGNILKFNAVGYYGDPRVPDLSDGSYYERISIRFSDGTNASPYINVRTVSHNPDSTSPASDGLPDDWMTTYFSHTTPQAGDKSRASDDADSDKLTNLQEYISGMDPKDSNSIQRAFIYKMNVIQWQAKAYELYEVEGKTNLASAGWTRVGNPIVPTGAMGTFSNDFSLPARFFRVQKVP